jgi:hypothetical protein
MVLGRASPVLGFPGIENEPVGVKSLASAPVSPQTGAHCRQLVWSRSGFVPWPEKDGYWALIPVVDPWHSSELFVKWFCTPRSPDHGVREAPKICNAVPRATRPKPTRSQFVTTLHLTAGLLETTYWEPPRGPKSPLIAPSPAPTKAISTPVLEKYLSRGLPNCQCPERVFTSPARIGGTDSPSVVKQSGENERGAGQEMQKVLAQRPSHCCLGNPTSSFRRR